VAHEGWTKAMTRRHFTPTEDSEQTVVCEWLRAKGIFFFSVPNEAALRSASKDRAKRFHLVNKLKHMGLTPGAPDLVIVLPGSCTMAGIKQSVCFLEMKRDSSCKLTHNQECVQLALANRGHLYLIGYGATDAIQKLEQLGC